MFNKAYDMVFGTGGLTIGLMTPAVRKHGHMADIGFAMATAQRAEQHGFAALWARDVPLMIPQGEDAEVAALDDPFVWLTALAAAAPTIALGTAAAVLPLRHPLHLAKAALSLDRLSGGRALLGLGSGDRQDEFAAFGLNGLDQGELFRRHWDVLRSALSPEPAKRELMLRTTSGYEVTHAPDSRVPMLVVGSARQSLQWIAANADGWATYHREDDRQRGRIELWRRALAEKAGRPKPFVQSLHLDLLARPDAPAEGITLGMRAGRIALYEYLERLNSAGIGHVLLHLVPGKRPMLDVIDEVGALVLPKVRRLAAGSSGADKEQPGSEELIGCTAGVCSAG